MKYFAICTFLVFFQIFAVGCRKNSESHTQDSTGLPFTVSKATTYVVEPLKDDGSVDYVSAINNHCSEGATPENNAACVLLPMEDGDLLWAEFADQSIVLERVNGSSSLSNVPKFSSLIEYANERQLDYDAINKKLFDYHNSEQLIDDGDGAGRIPELDDYLRENKTALDAVVEASRRPRWYVPIILESEDRIVESADITSANVVRRMAHILAVRCSQLIANREFEKAWQDVLAIKRLSHLLGQDSFWLGTTNGYALNEIACKFAGVIVEDPQARETIDAKAMLKQWTDQYQIVDVRDRTILFGRLAMLDLLCKLAKSPHGADASENDSRLTGSMEHRRSAISYVINRLTDTLPAEVFQRLSDGRNVKRWDAALKLINEHHDEMKSIWDSRPISKRNRLIEAFDNREMSTQESIAKYVEDCLSSKISDEDLGKGLAKILVDELEMPMKMFWYDETVQQDSQKVIAVALGTIAVWQESDEIPTQSKSLRPLLNQEWLSESRTGRPIYFANEKEIVTIKSSGIDGKLDSWRLSGKLNDDFVVELNFKK